MALKKTPTAAEVARAKSIFGMLGGRTRSPKQTVARRQNGKLGGAPRKYPKGTTGAQRYHLRNIAANAGRVTTPAQIKTLADLAGTPAQLDALFAVVKLGIAQEND